MNQRKLYIMAGVSGITALALILFPGWNGFHQEDDLLTMPLGHAWILSPPPAPYYGGLRVDRDRSDTIRIAVGALVFGATLIALGFTKAKQE